MNKKNVFRKVISAAAALLCAASLMLPTTIYASDGASDYEDVIIEEIIEEQKENAADKDEEQKNENDDGSDYEDLIIKDIIEEQKKSGENKGEADGEEKAEGTLEAGASDAAASEENQAKGRVIFLLYHDIAPGDTLGENDSPLWCTTEAKLREDIAVLYELGFESISCEMYYDGNYDPDGDYFVLTFDDGYISNYTLLPAILEETGTYADIFMCTEMTKLDNHFKYSDAKKMEEGGLVKVYSHYTTHEYLNELERGEMLRGLKLSFGYLNQRVGKDRDMFFAYPHSSFSRETILELYEFGVTLQFVQMLVPESYGIDPDEYGIVLRGTVGYETDIAALVDEYFALLENR